MSILRALGAGWVGPLFLLCNSTGVDYHLLRLEPASEKNEQFERAGEREVPKGERVDGAAA
jgi:hypothetical protein